MRRPFTPRAVPQAVDGVLLVLDPSRPEQERELEQLYVNFAQANRLATKQCMVLAMHVDLGAGQQPEWQGGCLAGGMSSALAAPAAAAGRSSCGQGRH